KPEALARSYFRRLRFGLLFFLRPLRHGQCRCARQVVLTNDRAEELEAKDAGEVPDKRLARRELHDDDIVGHDEQVFAWVAHGPIEVKSDGDLSTAGWTAHHRD